MRFSMSQSRIAGGGEFCSAYISFMMIEPRTAAGTRRPLKKSMEERMYSSEVVAPPRIERAVLRMALDVVIGEVGEMLNAGG